MQNSFKHHVSFEGRGVFHRVYIPFQEGSIKDRMLLGVPILENRNSPGCDFHNSQNDYCFFFRKIPKEGTCLHFYRSWARTICPRSDKAHCNQKEGILAGGPPCCCEKLNLLFDINITVLGNQLHGGFWTGSNSAPDFHGVSFT